MKNKLIICIIIAIIFLISSGCEMVEFCCYLASEYHNSCEQKGVAMGRERDIINTAETKEGVVMLGVQAGGNLILAAAGKDTKAWNNACNTSINNFMESRTGNSKTDKFVLGGSIVDAAIYTKRIRVDSEETKKRYEENVRQNPKYECFYSLVPGETAKGYKLQDGDVYWVIVQNDQSTISECLRMKDEESQYNYSTNTDYDNQRGNNNENTDEISDSQSGKMNVSEQLGEQNSEKSNENEAKSISLNVLESTKIDKFGLNDVCLTDEQKQELDNAAEILNKYSDVKICITGHTCSLGSESVNERVGMKRAEAGKEYLVGKGVPSERIILESKGETEPIAPNTKDSMGQNRRIEIKVIK